MKLRAYVPLLQDEFPAAAFCQDSLAAVARQCQWFPSYAEVARHLSAWWREHRPSPPALPPPPAPEPRPPPTPEELEHVRRACADVVASLRAAELYRDSQAFDDERAATKWQPQPSTRAMLEHLDRTNPMPNGRRRVDIYAPPAVEASDRPGLSPADDDQATAAS